MANHRINKHRKDINSLGKGDPTRAATKRAQEETREREPIPVSKDKNGKGGKGEKDKTTGNKNTSLHDTTKKMKHKNTGRTGAHQNTLQK